MAKKISPEKKISKLTEEIAALELTIQENQNKLAILRKEKENAENLEIISLIRKMNLTIDDVAEMIKNKITTVQVNPNPVQAVPQSEILKDFKERKILNEN